MSNKFFSKIMQKISLFLVLVVLLISCRPDNTNLKRQSAIASSLDSQQYELQYLGNFEHFDTLTNIFHDSISLDLAKKANQTFDVFASAANNLESMFEEGSHYITISELNSLQKDAYDKSVASLLVFYDAYNALVEYTNKFQPSPIIYTSFLINKGSTFGYHGFAFFDSDNNLINCRLFLNDEYKVLSSFIHHAKSSDYTFLTDTISRHISYPGFMASSEKADFEKYVNDRNSAIHIFRYVPEPYVPSTSDETVSSSVSSDFPANANLYRVKKQCGATYTKEANQRFTKYANANDLTSIDNMILNGEIEILNADDIVMMIDCGFSLSQVKTKRGTLLYVDTSSIKKID